MDESVQATAGDAIISKLSAATIGYFTDPYLRMMVRGKTPRRSPLINRGYYARVAAVTQLIDDYHNLVRQQDQLTTQIISLGAGFDTAYFRMAQDLQGKNVKFIEVDFESSTRAKVVIIRKNQELMDIIGIDEDKSNDCEIHGTQYHLVPSDLRFMGDVQTALQRCGVDFSQPLLLLSECVLVYMEPEESGSVISWFADRIHESQGCGIFISYEQIHPNDAFGEVMMENLRKRGCPLRGISAHKTLEGQMNRFKGFGWECSAALDMNDVYDHYIDSDEIARIQKLELFDEFEEWHLIQGHYCIAVSSIDNEHLSFSDQLPYIFLQRSIKGDAEEKQDE